MLFMSIFVASFYACQVLSNPRICRSFVAYFHITQWMVLAKLFQIVGPIFVPRTLQLLGLTFYSLKSVRQIYNYVSHDLTRNCLLTSESLPRFEKLCSTGTNVQNNFMFPTRKNSQKRLNIQKSTDIACHLMA